MTKSLGNPPAKTVESGRWARIEEIFHVALELEDTEREAYLVSRCTDTEMRHEVESLLSFDDASHTRVGPAVSSALVDQARELPLENRLGPYRVRGVLGRGGLSTVYLAERDDAEFTMKVAIKVIRHELDDDSMRDRLRQERQILAGLNHPNIARLLDGGTTTGDQPYFVLEHIEGQDLETYCQSRMLPLNDRLQIFQEVCSAVEYAHRNLVIHRDIKPANILVTADGIAKLLDFGIAKNLGPQASTELRVDTAPETRLLTPPFASPEQMRGEPLTTATDVYSLGVVLYRLLTGRHPYPLEGIRPSQVESVICQTIPQPPSEAVPKNGVNKLKRQLAGDLDVIVLKALRKEPDRRYRSVQNLREDLERHLTGLPVRARPDSLSYRAGKFLRRHKALASAIAIVLILTVLYTLQLAEERDRAQREAAKSDQLVSMMTGLFRVSGANEAKGETVTARELLDRGAHRIRADLADQPELRASMMDVMGDAYRSLGLFAAALPLYQDSLDAREATLPANHPDRASSLNRLGELRADLLELEPARDLLERAFKLRSGLLGADHRDTLSTLNNLAVVATYLGDLETAQSLFTQVLERRRKTLGPEHTEVATTLNNLADVQSRLGDLDAAESTFRQALELKLRTGDRVHSDVALVLNNLASLAEAREDPKAARELYQEALEINQAILDPVHPDITFGLRRLAKLDKNAGQLDSAIAFLEAAERHLATGPELDLLAAVLEDQGECRLLEDQPKLAEALFRRALKLRNQIHPEGSWRIAQDKAHLGASLLAQGKPSHAAPWLEAGYRGLLEHLGSEHRRTLAALESWQTVQQTATAPVDDSATVP